MGKRTHSKGQRKKRAPTMSAPRAPVMADIKSAPVAVSTEKKEKDVMSLSHGSGLSGMSFMALNAVKMNERWTVLEKLMALRGFDVEDQQTIRLLCEQAQANIEATR